MNEMDFKWKVRVLCWTYNQAPYIIDAMNGFTMQQTNFPFVCVIVDDASTDGELDIIHDYLKTHFSLRSNITKNEETDDYTMIFTQHRCNKNCFFSVYSLKYNHYSLKKPKLPYIKQWSDNAKFHALCEGDDYWTDVNKLQRQVDFLENHPTYNAISENGTEFFTKTGHKALFSVEPPRLITVSELIEKRRFPTASVLYRKDAIDKRYYQSKYKIDTILWCSLASNGNFYYNAINSSVYRRGPGVTVTTEPYEFAQLQENWHRELHLFFPDDYSEKRMKEFLISSYITAANRYIKLHQYFNIKILLCYIKVIKINPISFPSVFFKNIYNIFIKYKNSYLHK